MVNRLVSADSDTGKLPDIVLSDLTTRQKAVADAAIASFGVLAVPLVFNSTTELTASNAASRPAGARAKQNTTQIEWEVRFTGSTKRWVRMGGGTYHGAVSAFGPVNTATPTTLDSFGRVTADSDRDDFVTYSAGVWTLLEGDYSGVATVTLGSRPTTGSRTYIELQDGTTGAVLVRSSTWVEDNLSVPFVLHAGEAGRKIRVQVFQSNQASQTVNSHMYITKIA